MGNKKIAIESLLDGILLLLDDEIELICTFIENELIGEEENEFKGNYFELMEHDKTLNFNKIENNPGVYVFIIDSINNIPVKFDKVPEARAELRKNRKTSNKTNKEVFYVGKTMKLEDRLKNQHMREKGLDKPTKLSSLKLNHQNRFSVQNHLSVYIFKMIIDKEYYYLIGKDFEKKLQEKLNPIVGK